MAKPNDDVWKPYPGPQEDFLRCPVFEALYGGAAGGGKSQALLLGAMRHVGNPHYAALLLRRTVPELKRASGLIDRAYQIFPGAGGKDYESGKLWEFPSGARIELASMEHPNDRFNYASSEYQYIAFDELTSFEEVQYTFMISRLRSAHGIPLRLRAGSNPGGLGHDWVLKRFAPWLYPREGEPHHDPGYEGTHARAGERLYFRWDQRLEREVECPRGWFDEACASCSSAGACPKHAPKGRVFFPARVEDNPSLAGTAYEANLDALDAVTRQQLKHGNWMARPAAGAYFKRAWFKIVDAFPAFVTGRVRYWDRAATEDPKADFTAGVRMSRTAGGIYFVEHVQRGQWGPGEVESTIVSTAETDPSNTRTCLEQDPGQAGKAQRRYDLKALEGHDVHFVPPLGDKVTRAKPLSAQAEGYHGEHGNVVLVRGPWNEAFIRELEAFPEGKDDQVDGASGAFSQLLMLSGVKSKATGSRVAVPSRMGGV